MTLHRQSARGLLKAYGEGADPGECLTACLEDVRNAQKSLNAFLWIDDQVSPSAASGSLTNVPLAVKDNILTQDVPTTAASSMLEGYLPPYEATVVRKLREAGAVMVAKTNMDEFGMGSSNEYSAFGAVKNPWNTSRVPGGSSGGSAAAVASGCVPAALGTDTGGSIRQPSALCGIYGLKPTYGRVSRRGLVAFASSLDQIGPMARDLHTLALVYACIAGADDGDQTLRELPWKDPVKALDEPLRGIRVGFAEDLLRDCAADVQLGVQTAVDALSAKTNVSPVAWPDPKQGISAYYVIANAEASSNLARYDGVRYGRRAEAESLQDMYRMTREQGFGPEVKRRILLGTYVLSAGYVDRYYGRAIRTRERVSRMFADQFERVDVIALPTTPTTAFALGEKIDDPLSMYLADVFTVGPSLAGLPAMSVPVGMNPEGLPLGLQIVAPRGREDVLFTVASNLRGALGWEPTLPPEAPA